MATIITLDIFSGRPNPSWLLSQEAEQQLMDRLLEIDEITLRKPSGVLGRLGYRGFRINRTTDDPSGALRLFVHEGIIDNNAGEPNRIAPNRELEQWLLGIAPESLSEELREIVSQALVSEAVDIDAYLSTPSVQ